MIRPNSLPPIFAVRADQDLVVKIDAFVVVLLSGAGTVFAPHHRHGIWQRAIIKKLVLRIAFQLRSTLATVLFDVVIGTSTAVCNPFHSASPSILAPQIGQYLYTPSTDGSSVHHPQILHLAMLNVFSVSGSNVHRPCTTGATSAASIARIVSTTPKITLCLNLSSCRAKSSKLLTAASRSMYSAIVRSPPHIRHAVLRVITAKTRRIYARITNCKHFS